ncbi:hypothetical protein F2Q69_00025480 [Brassica cretica]|uniref:Uncharacterized protein n=1 Tax=Brassica cretica TaxID=69181 RepID=A0A8S9QAI7_BRACR|nr:hypothetical protein F2Q69_00025480 [Brassica cretica]
MTTKRPGAFITVNLVLVISSVLYGFKNRFRTQIFKTRHKIAIVVDLQRVLFVDLDILQTDCNPFKLLPSKPMCFQSSQVEVPVHRFIGCPIKWWKLYFGCFHTSSFEVVVSVLTSFIISSLLQPFRVSIISKIWVRVVWCRSNWSDIPVSSSIFSPIPSFSSYSSLWPQSLGELIIGLVCHAAAPHRHVLLSFGWCKTRTSFG